MKAFILLFLFFIPIAFFYDYLDKKTDGSWWDGAVIAVILIMGRIILYIYRKNKNIRDDYFDH